MKNQAGSWCVSQNRGCTDIDQRTIVIPWQNSIHSRPCDQIHAQKEQTTQYRRSVVLVLVCTRRSQMPPSGRWFRARLAEGERGAAVVLRSAPGTSRSAALKPLVQLSILRKHLARPRAGILHLHCRAGLRDYITYASDTPLHRLCSVVVITQDSESCNRGSTPRTSYIVMCTDAASCFLAHFACRCGEIFW